MGETTIRDEVRKLAEQLPENATWDDVGHLVALHQKLARARRESAAGLGITVEEARKRFGLNG